MSGKTGAIIGFGAEGANRADAGNTINIVIIGASGRVGRRLLELIATRHATALTFRVHLRVVAVANSRTWLIAREGLAPTLATERLASADSTNADAFADSLNRLPRPLVVVDCSTSAEIAARYPQWLTAGIDVVTPNKLGPSADRPLACAIAAAQAASGAVLRQLVRLGLIASVPRDDAESKELLYGTTPRFLEVFRVRDLDDLPQLGAPKRV